MSIPKPVHVIATGARGLSAITIGSDRVYMGFMGTMESSNLQIHAYSLDDYKQLSVIELEIEENIVS